ncbi:major facilitator superfamily domain-containing protein [Gautieria morchelliformis]|nr:major facilitator superfamily domain-containing protein [Gautieria morchelliformis]
MSSQKLSISPNSSLAAGLETPVSSTVTVSQTKTKDAESCVESLANGGHSRFISLLMAHLGAALALFLATTDATIVSTSLPTIAADLQASQNQYSWVGISYMLTQTACQPLYPVFSHLAGRKAVLFVSIFIFVVGSALCGAAQATLWLIVTRAVQGIGAGGIVNSVWVLTSDIVTPQEKNKWSQALSATWSASAIAGPLLGGVFSQHSQGLSWRWAFYMNVPIGLIALCLLYWSLRHFDLEKTLDDFSWPVLRAEFMHKFDYIGVFLLVTGTSCTVLGFSFAAQQAWTAPAALALLILGPLLLVIGVVYETRTTRVAILPSALFRSRTEVIILFASFFHNVAFNAGTFYLALYYQAALGVGPLLSGVLMLPYALGGALASVPIAVFNDYFSRKTLTTVCYKYVIVTGLAVATIGFGLLTLLDVTSSIAEREIYPMIAGVGIGMLFHAPFAALTNGMSSQDRSRTTSAFFLVRFIGATSGLSVAGAIFQSRLEQAMPSNAPPGISGASLDLGQLAQIEPMSLRTSVLGAVSAAISSIWIVCVCCLGAAFLVSFAIRIVPIEMDETYLDGTASPEPSHEKSCS